MKIKRSTFFLVLAALLLGGVTVVILQTQPPTTEQGEQTEQQNIFAFKEEQVQSFTLQNRSDSYKFERDGEKQWQMVEPEQTPASDASIAFLLGQLATGKSERSISVPAADRDEFGFDNPLATVEVTLDNQETHKLVLGGYDFNHSFIYALVDPATDEKADLRVLLVSPNFENAVTRPREEWKQAADEVTTPSPSASPSPTPTSPSPSASPSPISD
jgi:hypothetical protein